LLACGHDEVVAQRVQGASYMLASEPALRVLHEFGSGVEPSPTLRARCERIGLPDEVAFAVAAVATRMLALLARCERPKGANERFGRQRALAQIRRSLDSFVADAVRIAMIADPATGDALVRVWDEVCDVDERGLLAWSLGAATNSARRYGKRLTKRDR
jgi:hypothetical protein